MAICKDCGCSNPDTCLFCWKCGSKLEESEVVISPEPIAEQVPVAPVAEEMHYEAAPAEPFVAAPVVAAIPEQPGTARRSIDLGGPGAAAAENPRSIDLGPSGESAEPAGKHSSRKSNKPKAKRAEKNAPSGSFLSDPFNAKITVLICGLLSIMIACYAIFGYRPTVSYDSGWKGTLSSIFALASDGCNGLFPADTMSMCIAFTMVVTILGALRVIPILGGVAGMVTTALYYNMECTLYFGGEKATISTESLVILMILWVVVIVLSVFQAVALKSYSAACEDEPYPLVGIWFGRL